MSDQLRDGFGYIIADRDSIDGLDPWDNEEITEIIKQLNNTPKTTQPWLDSSWYPPVRKCTCGAEATYGKTTTHSSWCDKVKP